MSFAIYQCPKCKTPQLKYVKSAAEPDPVKKCSRCGKDMKPKKDKK